MKLTYIGYSHNGLGNQFCSLQLVAGLSGYFKDENINLVWDKQWQGIEDPQVKDFNKVDTSKIDKYLDNSTYMTLFDLVDFNFNNIIIYDNDLFIKDRNNVNLIHSQRNFLNVSESQKNIDFFRGNKKEIIFDNTRENILNQTLVWYSNFFYDRSSNIDNAIKTLVFKKEYTDFADKIVQYLGEYNGIHARIMKDHFIYYKLTDERFNQGIDKLNNKNIPIVCSVDNYNDPIIIKNKHRIILVEDIVLNEFLSDFKQLPFQNRIVLALISALVMSKAKDFIGTPYSTFSTMIFQMRNNLIEEDWKYFPSGLSLFDSYDKLEEPYSWVKTGQGISWERDWKESKLNV